MTGTFPLYKRVTAGAVLALMGLWVAYLLLWPNPGSDTAGEGIAVGSPAPDFELKTIDGKRYKLSELKGKPVMINFFASWCPPCRSEMPVLQDAYTEYQAKGFTILAVDLGESAVAIRSFQEKLGITFPIIVDEHDRVSKLYDIVPLPTSYFIDRKGIVQARWQGELRKEQVRALIQKIL